MLKDGLDCHVILISVCATAFWMDFHESLGKTCDRYGFLLEVQRFSNRYHSFVQSLVAMMVGLVCLRSAEKPSCRSESTAGLTDTGDFTGQDDWERMQPCGGDYCYEGHATVECGDG